MHYFTGLQSHIACLLKHNTLQVLDDSLMPVLKFCCIELSVALLVDDQIIAHLLH